VHEWVDRAARSHDTTSRSLDESVDAPAASIERFARVAGVELARRTG
jgi:hypothetical protein